MMRTFVKQQGLLGLAIMTVGALSLLWFFPARGLIAEYYANREWTRPPVFTTQEKQITLRAVRERSATFPQTNFSVTWFGWMRIDRAGEYRFATVSDDGSSLAINNVVVVENGGYHAERKVVGKIVLASGLHFIRINYFQGEADYDLQVFWQAPGQPETPLPAQILYPAPFPLRGLGWLSRYLSVLYPLAWGMLLLIVIRHAVIFLEKDGAGIREVHGKLRGFGMMRTFVKQQGLLGLAIVTVGALSLLWFFPARGLIAEYYANREWTRPPVFTTQEKQITLRAVRSRPAAFPQTNFSVTWFGWIRIDRAGEYRFATASDDGSSLAINNVVVVENGGYHVEQKVAGKIFLPSGLHFIRINYVQGEEDYTLKVFWQAPGQPETPLPAQILYPAPFPLRGLGWLSRYLSVLYPLAWGMLLLIVIRRTILRNRGRIPQLLKASALNLALAVSALAILFGVLEGAMRLVLFLREDRQDTQAQLKASQAAELPSGTRTYSLKGMVQLSPFEGIVYELKPNLKGNFLDVPLTTNSQGLRDVEYSYQKPENTFRIVALGDSSVFGWGVKLEETSLKVLERQLNQHAAGRRYQVLNFAAPGYNTAMEAEVFVQKCVQYAPDLVILHFNTNDYDLPRFMKPSQSYATLRKSYLLNWLYARLHLLWSGPEEEIVPVAADETAEMEETDRLDEDPTIPEAYRTMVGEKGFLRALDKLVQAVKERGIPLVVYVVKSYPGLAPDYKPNPFRDRQLQLITQLSQEKGFWLLNMYAAYMQYLKAHPDVTRKVFWVAPADSHPSAIAHQIEAETLYNFLSTHHLVN